MLVGVSVGVNIDIIYFYHLCILYREILTTLGQQKRNYLMDYKGQNFSKPRLFPLLPLWPPS